MKTEKAIVEHLNIELTGWCNQKCTYCFNDSGVQKKKQQFSYNEWKNIVRFFKGRGLESVHFTGGEPFGHKDILQFIQSSDEEGLATTVLSNGLNIAKYAKTHPHILGKIQKAQISLDSLDSKIMEKRRGHPSALKDALSAIHSFSSLGVSLEISAVLDETNKHEMEQLRNFADDIGAGLLIRRFEKLGRARQLDVSNIPDIHGETADEFYYMPSLRNLGAKLGKYTIESTGRITPSISGVLDKGLFHLSQIKSIAT